MKMRLWGGTKQSTLHSCSRPIRDDVRGQQERRQEDQFPTVGTTHGQISSRSHIAANAAKTVNNQFPPSIHPYHQNVHAEKGPTHQHDRSKRTTITRGQKPKQRKDQRNDDHRAELRAIADENGE